MHKIKRYDTIQYNTKSHAGCRVGHCIICLCILYIICTSESALRSTYFHFIFCNLRKPTMMAFFSVCISSSVYNLTVTLSRVSSSSSSSSSSLRPPLNLVSSVLRNDVSYRITCHPLTRSFKVIGPTEIIVS